MGRIQQAGKNIIFGYVSNFVILLMNFIQRTVFIMVLGRTLLGVNSIYTNVLNVLSLAELGIGTALNYSLYKPVANRDTEKIKSYMRLYKKAYLSVAVVITIIGVAISPFLKYILKNPGNYSIRDLTVYYFIFLFNTVITYFVAYKYSLPNAEQKNYIQTNVTTITKIVTVLIQIIVLVVTKNFLFYLLAQSFVELIQKIFVSIYLNRMYPYLREKNVQKLSEEETGVVVRKAKALMLHKIGDVARLQTDTIIISSFVNVDTSGVVGNYTYILTYIGNFVNIIFSSVISGLGNLVATESREKQYQIFKVYRFFACWLFGFGAVGFWHLLTPLIGGLWLDESWVIGSGVVTLITVDFYFKGGRSVLENFKIAAGVFEQDRYLPLVQGGLNLVLSIVLVQRIGVAGVYVGTLVSGILANLIRPVIIYRVCFDRKAWGYFADSLRYLAVIFGIAVINIPIRHLVMKETNLLTFGAMVIVISIIYNVVFFLVFHKTEEFGYLWDVAARKIPVLRKWERK